MTTLNLTPKPMSRVALPTPPRSTPRISSPSNLAKQLGIKPVEARKIERCEHVLPKAVWCQNCADSNLAYARKAFAKYNLRAPAISASVKETLRAALHEFSLTPKGILMLDREYVNMVGKDSVQAAAFRERLQAFRVESSHRNQLAREENARKKARETTDNSIPTAYVNPPRDKDGHMTTVGSNMRTTHHATKRMSDREIPLNDMLKAFRSPVAFEPQGRGRWRIIGENEIVLCGFFTKHRTYIDFTVATTYHLEHEGEED